jgi:hypothetical protein
MKSLSKLIAVAIAVTVVFITTETKAQITPANTFGLSLGIETGLPMGTAKLGATNTLGGTVRLQYGVSNSFALTLTTGGYHYFPKKNPSTGKRYGSYGEIPVKIGVKEFFVKNVYVGGEIGTASEKLESGWGPTRLDLSPALGYAIQHWDLGVHYENFSRRGEDSLGLINLRLAYSFGL